MKCNSQITLTMTSGERIWRTQFGGAVQVMLDTLPCAMSLAALLTSRDISRPPPSTPTHPLSFSAAMTSMYVHCHKISSPKLPPRCNPNAFTWPHCVKRGQVYACNTTDGSVLWTFATKGGVMNETLVT